MSFLDIEDLAKISFNRGFWVGAHGYQPTKVGNEVGSGGIAETMTSWTYIHNSLLGSGV